VRADGPAGGIALGFPQGGARNDDGDGAVLPQDELGVTAGEGTPDDGFGTARAPIVRNLSRTIKIRVHAGNEQEVVIPTPVGIVPGIVDDLDFCIGWNQRGDKQADLRLQYTAVVCPTAVIIREYRDDANSHLLSPY